VTDSAGLVDRTSADVPVADPTPTNVVISARPNRQTIGHPVRITVQVTSAGGTPTGNVTLFQNGHRLGTKALSGGTATFRTATLPAGRHTITASYAGDANFAPSSGALPRPVVIRRP
jgi:hypothetical protein